MNKGIAAPDPDENGQPRVLREGEPSALRAADAQNETTAKAAVAALKVPVTTWSSERIVAFMDIGTNSIRLLLVKLNPNRSHMILSQQKEVVRLGEDEFVDHYLQPEAMERAALVCRKFVEMAHAYGVEEIVAIATSATREARNQGEFIRLLRQETGIDVRTISGREEARLIYLGVASGIHMDGSRGLFVDIGGGSTEVVVGDQSEYQLLESLKLGAIRLSTLFFMPQEQGPVSSERYGLVKRYVRNASLRSVQKLKKQRYDFAVGSSGTIENLADIAIRREFGRDRQRDDVLSLEQLEAVMTHLCALGLEERRKVPGINPGRADLIIAGGAVLHALMEEIGLPEIRVSDRGLREGLIVDYIARRGPGATEERVSVRDRSVTQLASACGFDESHAKVVRRLAWELFDDARGLGLHNLGADERELLGYAAILHDIGTFLSYTNHQDHTYYLIRNADLVGFDQSEISIIATAARFHRKGYPKKKHPEYRALAKRERRAVRPMAVFLRIAESLDRSHAGLIKSARLHKVDREHVGLMVTATQDSELEMWGVKSHARMFEKAFKRRLLVRFDRDSE